MHPELSGKEFDTARFVADRLVELGLDVTTNVGQPLPGVVALLRGSSGGKTVALRADMDALAVTEQNDVPYRSRVEGAMHACGHDAHTAILLGAAEVLSRYKGELSGNVKFIFEPSEEYVGGALPMIRAGVLSDPEVNAVFALHVDPSYRVGEIGISYGETLAASDRLIIRIKGKSAHGATPHLAVDSVVVAAHAIIALQSVISREKDPLSPAVLSFGVFQGGNQPNSIADEVLIRGILRTLNPNVREDLIRKIEQVLKGITESFGASYEFTREKSYDTLINDDRMVDFLKRVAIQVIGTQGVKLLERPRLIVEDFAYFLQKVPGAFFFLGCGNPEKGLNHPLHSSRFDIDEGCLPLGVALEVALAMTYLKEG
ncbi:MAG TPA: amidohydrolase [Firmicutes bacterium]|nr:amidohydrolase [Bacillota bacterium]